MDGTQFFRREFGFGVDERVPGNAVGSATADTMHHFRFNNPPNVWETLDVDAITVQPVVSFAVGDSFIPIGGDYDGDGFDDYTIWNLDNGVAEYTIRPSSDTANLITFTFDNNQSTIIAASRNRIAGQ